MTLAKRCETNDKEKTAAIEEAEARITALTSAIEEGTATSSRLNTEIKNLEAEIAKNQESLDKATAMRQVSLGMRACSKLSHFVSLSSYLA